ncbi:MAG: hypothetical protein K9W44_15725 [Candidatus Lokiarchaeota archaeon]|nr:hypothetical protein [Candidatus Harpocratesius repetitus]
MIINNHSIYNQLLDKISYSNDINILNKYFNQEYGFISFFSSSKKVQDFKTFLKKNLDNQKSIEFDYQDLGDFQTPFEFSVDVCNFLSKITEKSEVLIEPTCGKGNFVLAALKTIPSIKYIYCVEIQSKYEWIFKIRLILFLKTYRKRVQIEFHNENIFTHEFSPKFLDMMKEKDCIILGNPPWVTNTELENLGSKNLPKKSNFKKFKGIDSITGKSNFDIAEYIIYHLISKFDKYNGYICMLCKNIVIRNIIKENPKLYLNIGEITQLNFDSKKIFNINANASVFIAKLNSPPEYTCVSTNFHNSSHRCELGWYHKKFVSDIAKYKETEKFDGNFSYEWRQGIKHDLSRIMVLKKHDDKGEYINGNKEKIALEEDLIFPYLKSSDLKKMIVNKSRFFTIITQKKVGEDTKYIKEKFPKTWNYLNQNVELFRRRKSSIYRNKPDFSIFGIGKYSFAKFKIGVSGLYKKLNFALIYPIGNKPVMLDDTCYLVPFGKKKDAIITWTYLNCKEVSQFMESITFQDTKRPYTKDVLMRIDLHSIVKNIELSKILDFYKKELFNLTNYELKLEDFKTYRKNLDPSNVIEVDKDKKKFRSF